MNTTKYLVLGMMALGLSTAGCAQEENNTTEDVDSVELAENPTGGRTNNDTRSGVYHANKYKLLAAMGSGLGTWTCQLYVGCFYALPSSIYQTGILNTSEGQELFNKAIECAVADGVTVKQTQVSGTTSPRRYVGKGLMSTTAGWISGPLTTAQKEDVFRCVVARVNSFGVQVDIAISGQNVTNQPGEDDGLQWQPDALFDVKLTTITLAPPFSGQTTVITEYAWPLALVQSLPGTCMSLQDAMEARVCDQAASSCSFHVREAPQDDCLKYRGSPYYYQCSTTAGSVKRPVVQSWVVPNDMVKVFGYNQTCQQGTSITFDPLGLDPYIPYSP